MMVLTVTFSVDLRLSVLVAETRAPCVASGGDNFFMPSMLVSGPARLGDRVQ
jgi:hypothetical protein